MTDNRSRAARAIEDGIGSIFGLPKKVSVSEVNKLLDVNIWAVRSFAADVRIHFDEYSNVLRAELLNAPTHGDAKEQQQPTDEECASCGEGMQRGECPNSRRECGHHCNHVWTHDNCDWCGKEFRADQ